MTKTITMPGTEVIVVRREDNPAAEEANQQFLQNGYWEVVVVSNGSNPLFPCLMWRILLVTPHPDFQMEPYTENDHTVVPVDADTEIKRAETLIGEVPTSNGSWPCSGLELHLSSKRGEQKAFFSCAPLATKPPVGSVIQ
ncbi:MAG: hypothetical protein RL538_362 [Candidatus Parcubacteria bacterium]|jgi:hypothetical protein